MKEEKGGIKIITLVVALLIIVVILFTAVVYKHYQNKNSQEVTTNNTEDLNSYKQKEEKKIIDGTYRIDTVEGIEYIFKNNSVKLMTETYSKTGTYTIENNNIKIVYTELDEEGLKSINEKDELTIVDENTLTSEKIIDGVVYSGKYIKIINNEESINETRNKSEEIIKETSYIEIQVRNKNNTEDILTDPLKIYDTEVIGKLRKELNNSSEENRPGVGVMDAPVMITFYYKDGTSFCIDGYTERESKSFLFATQTGKRRIYYTEGTYDIEQYVNDIYKANSSKEEITYEEITQDLKDDEMFYVADYKYNNDGTYTLYGVIYKRNNNVDGSPVGKLVQRSYKKVTVSSSLEIDVYRRVMSGEPESDSETVEEILSDLSKTSEFLTSVYAPEANSNLFGFTFKNGKCTEMYYNGLGI